MTYVRKLRDGKWWWRYVMERMEVDVRVMGGFLRGMERCPHCGTANPSLPVIHILGEDPRTGRRDLLGRNRWHIAECASCLAPVCFIACVRPEEASEDVHRIIPAGFVVDESVPLQASRYIGQAYETLSSPDASIVMLSSAVDAMLKDQGLKDGSLHDRIKKAVEQGIVTEKMSDWMHHVRLGANNSRHADGNAPPPNVIEARRSFECAKALAEILYVLPSRMPNQAASD